MKVKDLIMKLYDFNQEAEITTLYSEMIDEFVDRISAEVDSAYPIQCEIVGVDDGG